MERSAVEVAPSTAVLQAPPDSKFFLQLVKRSKAGLTTSTMESPALVAQRVPFQYCTRALTGWYCSSEPKRFGSCRRALTSTTWPSTRARAALYPYSELTPSASVARTYT